MSKSNSHQLCKILACQIEVPLMTTAEQRDVHVRRCASLVKARLDTEKIDLVVLPELSSIDYSRDAFASLAKLAEPLEGNSFMIWREVALACKCWVVFGFAHQTDSGYSIATCVVSPDGRCVGSYNKLHLAQFGDSMEKEYFTAGEQQLLVFDINGYRFAPIICYDIRFPELCRALVLDHKVDCIIHTGAYARDPSFYSWHAFATIRAIENQVYFLSLNRAGGHFGHSVFCPPWIDEDNQPLTFDEHNEQLSVVEIDRTSIETARTDYTFLQDRLADYQLKLITS